MSSQKGAQRLSASLNSALLFSLGVFSLLMCSTPFGITEFGTAYALNLLAAAPFATSFQG
jgi:hypothetical protein